MIGECSVVLSGAVVRNRQVRSLFLYHVCMCVCVWYVCVCVCVCVFFKPRLQSSFLMIVVASITYR